MCVHVHKFRFHGNCICVCGIRPPKVPNSSLFFLVPQWILHAKVLLSLSYSVPYEEVARWMQWQGQERNPQCTHFLVGGEVEPHTAESYNLLLRE